MSGALFLISIFYLIYTLVRLTRRPAPSSLGEYFSFGSSQKPSSLRDAFFVTNATFSTAFVSLCLFVSSQGILAFVTPAAFAFGTICYTKWILPTHFEILLSGRRFPELLGVSTKSALVRMCVSIFVL